MNAYSLRTENDGLRLTKRQWRAISEALHLSDRQHEIVACLCEGLTEDAAAGRLGISPHTVHTHMRRVYQNLRIHNRAELVMRIFETHLQESERSLPAPTARPEKNKRKRSTITPLPTPPSLSPEQVTQHLVPTAKTHPQMLVT